MLSELTNPWLSSITYYYSSYEIFNRLSAVCWERGREGLCRSLNPVWLTTISAYIIIPYSSITLQISFLRLGGTFVHISFHQKKNGTATLQHLTVMRTIYISKRDNLFLW